MFYQHPMGHPLDRAALCLTMTTEAMHKEDAATPLVRTANPVRSDISHVDRSNVHRGSSHEDFSDTYRHSALSRLAIRSAGYF
jgi:hypothetical protein